MTKEELLLVLSDPDEFKRRVTNTDQLTIAASEFPEYAGALIRASKILADYTEFQKFVTNLPDLYTLAFIFSDHRDSLIAQSRILDDDHEFNRLVQPTDFLIKFLRVHRGYTESLIQRSKILTDDAAFNKFLTNASELLEIAEQLPKHAEALFQRSKILTDDTAFNKFIPTSTLASSTWWLKEMARVFPNHTDELMQKVLRDPALFDRLIHDDAGLKAIKPYCPNISMIQNANTFQEARDAVKAEMIEKNKQANEARYTAFFRGQKQLEGLEGAQQDLAERTARGEDLGKPKK
jgi:hypothetical protein